MYNFNLFVIFLWENVDKRRYCYVLVIHITAVDKQLEDLCQQRRLLEPRRDFTAELQDISQVQILLDI